MSEIGSKPSIDNVDSKSLENNDIKSNLLDKYDPNEVIPWEDVKTIIHEENYDPNEFVEDLINLDKIDIEEYDPNKLVEWFENEDTDESFDSNRRFSNDAVDSNESKEENLERIICRNDNLKDSVHEKTGVPFVEKEIVNSDNEKVIGVFPQFKETVNVQLPESLYQATDKRQFSECNHQLANLIESVPSLKEKFKERQLEQIKNGDTPDGFVWHHNEDIGKMQLVDLKTHMQTGHTGGKSIWGEGNR